MSRNGNSVNIIYIAITCLIFLNIFIYTKIITKNIPEANYASVPPSDDAAQNPNSSNSDEPAFSAPECRYITANVADTLSGPLVLVNKTHPYTFDNIPSVSPKEENGCIYENKTANYYTKDTTVYMNLIATEALNRMMDDFYAANGNKKSIIITEGLRTYEEQENILKQKIEEYGEGQTIAQKPGDSEHHTGYAMDINVYDGKIMSTFTGENEYSWIFENAYKYGFILRYPETKEQVTGIRYESWHFRYVGIPHAQYMYENNLTLEEYTDMLALYPYESAHLSVTDKVSGEEYSIYSVKVGADETSVPVPLNEDAVYTVSGDNCGHVIITEKKQALQ